MQRPEDCALPCWTCTALRTGDLLSITHTHTHTPWRVNRGNPVWTCLNRQPPIITPHTWQWHSGRYMYRQVHKYIYYLFAHFFRHLSSVSSWVLLMLTIATQCKDRSVRRLIQTQNNVMRAWTRASRHFRKLRYQCSTCTSSLGDWRLLISLFSMHMRILGTCSSILTKQRREVGCEGVDWIHVAQDRE